MKPIEAGLTLDAKAQSPNPSGCRIVWAPHSKRKPIRVYGYDVSSATYNLVAAYTYNVDLSEDFRLVRFVSGKISCQSNTISSTLVSIKGSMNGVTVLDAPDLRVMSYSDATAYKTNGSFVVPQENVTSGIQAIGMPMDSRMFFSPSTSVVTNGSFKAQARSSADVDGGGVAQGPGWASVTPFFDSDSAGSWLPPNLYGKTHLKMTLFGTANAAPAYTAVTIKVWHTTALSTDWSRLDTATQTEVMAVPMPGVVNGVRLDASIHIDNDAEITRIEIVSSGTQVLTLIDGYDSFVQWTNWTVADPRDTGYLSIMTMSGLEPDQQIGISAVANYQAIPDLDLLKNLPSNYGKRSMHPDEFYKVRAMLEHASELGIRWIYSGRDANLVEQRAASLVTRRDVDTFSSTGFWDWIKNAGSWLYDNVLKPGASVITKVAPLLANGPLRSSGVEEMLKALGIEKNSLDSATLKKLLALNEKSNPSKEKLSNDTKTKKPEDHHKFDVKEKYPWRVPDRSKRPYKCSGTNVINADPRLPTKKEFQRFLRGLGPDSHPNVAYFPAVLGSEHVVAVCAVTRQPVRLDGMSFCGLKRQTPEYTEIAKGVFLALPPGSRDDAIQQTLRVVKKLGVSGNVYVALCAVRALSGPSCGLAIYAAMAGWPRAPFAYTGAFDENLELDYVTEIGKKLRATRRHSLQLIACTPLPPNDFSKTVNFDEFFAKPTLKKPGMFVVGDVASARALVSSSMSRYDTLRMK
jgi:hypothetical protein